MVEYLFFQIYYSNKSDLLKWLNSEIREAIEYAFQLAWESKINYTHSLKPRAMYLHDQRFHVFLAAHVNILILYKSHHIVPIM